MVGQLSTAKSPQQMFGAVMKTYFAQSIGVDPGKHCYRIRYALRCKKGRGKHGFLL